MKEILNQIKCLTAGDLVMLEWHDASIGKSLSNGVSGIDVPVKSWGVYIGTLGQKRRHIILAQNCFRYSDGLYDIDYTAIPVPWTTNATIIAKAHVDEAEAKDLLNSFLVNEKTKSDKPTLGRCLKQQRVRNHD
ncbi:MAG: hypothetical protein NWE99_00925 [Candidatus Bathyarchaeota archaeon]|nr:hypothetical protein [Candidatus Bathyarchaeota archaeon]